MANILITSGGTTIPIDPVRSIKNTSKGYFGSQLALSALKQKHNVYFFTANDAKYKPFNINIDVKDDCYDTEDAHNLRRLYESVSENYTETHYTTYESYVNILNIIKRDTPDIIFMAAAVSDYTVVPIKDKVRSKDNLNLQFTPTEKIISMVKKMHPSTYLVGFKMLVDATDDELIGESRNSMRQNGCDAVIANNYDSIRNNDHKIIVTYRDGNQVCSHNYYLKDIGYEHIFKLIHSNYTRKQEEN